MAPLWFLSLALSMRMAVIHLNIIMHSDSSFWVSAACQGSRGGTADMLTVFSVWGVLNIFFLIASIRLWVWFTTALYKCALSGGCTAVERQFFWQYFMLIVFKQQYCLYPSFHRHWVLLRYRRCISIRQGWRPWGDLYENAKGCWCIWLRCWSTGVLLYSSLFMWGCAGILGALGRHFSIFWKGEEG